MLISQNFHHNFEVYDSVLPAGLPRNSFYFPNHQTVQERLLIFQHVSKKEDRKLLHDECWGRLVIEPSRSNVDLMASILLNDACFLPPKEQNANYWLCVSGVIAVSVTHRIQTNEKIGKKQHRNVRRFSDMPSFWGWPNGKIFIKFHICWTYLCKWTGAHLCFRMLQNRACHNKISFVQKFFFENLWTCLYKNFIAF